MPAPKLVVAGGGGVSAGASKTPDVRLLRAREEAEAADKTVAEAPKTV
jgi:hypothetical protein